MRPSASGPSKSSGKRSSTEGSGDVTFRDCHTEDAPALMDLMRALQASGRLAQGLQHYDPRPERGDQTDHASRNSARTFFLARRISGILTCLGDTRTNRASCFHVRCASRAQLQQVRIPDTCRAKKRVKFREAGGTIRTPVLRSTVC